MKRCIFCGELLNDAGVCPNAVQHFKPMCLNCQYNKLDTTGYICENEENKNDTVKKIIASFEGSYEITNIELRPIALKDPTKKCKRYTFNSNTMLNGIADYLVPSQIPNV